jgi:hypothetical protein
MYGKLAIAELFEEIGSSLPKMLSGLFVRLRTITIICYIYEQLLQEREAALSLRGGPHRGDEAISREVLLAEIATSDASSQ